MNSSALLSCLGLPSADAQVEGVFNSLGTHNRPVHPMQRGRYHDWVLVRRQGVELGFADSEYHTAASRTRWGYGVPLLTQVYFYAGFDSVRPYPGSLPYGLQFSDGREVVRQKLSAFEATRHSYLSDTWDVDGCRLSVAYAGTDGGIDRMACRLLAAPIPREGVWACPPVQALLDAFGSPLATPSFATLWQRKWTAEDLVAAKDEGEIDLTRTQGATLTFTPSADGPVFRAITLHRNRDMESAGWCGHLPHGLDFDDSPEVLFVKIQLQPAQHANSALTGHAVWHFDSHTLHVLYSHVDNRLLRIKLIAPGTWRSVDER